MSEKNPKCPYCGKRVKSMGGSVFNVSQWCKKCKRYVKGK